MDNVIPEGPDSIGERPVGEESGGAGDAGPAGAAPRGWGHWPLVLAVLAVAGVLIATSGKDSAADTVEQVALPVVGGLDLAEAGVLLRLAVPKEGRRW
ncbi:hypothetical protein IIA16_03505, partial [bacterium]|nr:hypothetical protein [bacterium]